MNSRKSLLAVIALVALIVAACGGTPQSGSQADASQVAPMSRSRPDGSGMPAAGATANVGQSVGRTSFETDDPCGPPAVRSRGGHRDRARARVRGADGVPALWRPRR